MKQHSKDLQHQQRKTAREENLVTGDIVMAKLHVPNCKQQQTFPKFTGPYKVLENAGGNKYKIQLLKSGEVTNRHADDLKKTNISREEENSSNDIVDDTDETHEYKQKLRSHYKDFSNSPQRSNSEKVLLLCNITEFFLQDELDILKICKGNWELITLSTDKYEIANMYAVSDASYGVGPCEARRLSKKSWRHDHRKSVN